MSIRIRRLKLVSDTLKGRYSADLKFPDGLVLFHVKNTSGKSTALKSIIYALGLERMFGAANRPPLTPAMMSAIEDGGQEYPVVESNVFLEISNHDSRIVTLRRKVVGEGGKSWKLVDVWEGSRLDTDLALSEPKSYYVRDEGSATREQGFSRFLADFIGWNLPNVVRFDGPPCPLYMECLLPLFYVEQSHGWTAIQATTPRYFGIRQVERKAIEFILALDSSARDTERQLIEKEEGEIQQNWFQFRAELGGLLQSFGGVMRNVPTDPNEEWPPNPEPFPEVYEAGQPLPLSVAIDSDKQILLRQQNEPIPTIDVAANEIQRTLDSTLAELSQAEAYSAETYEDIQLERANLSAIETRLPAVTENLDHNLGTKKLRDMGATQALSVVTGKCPTCQQPVSDTLLSQEPGSHIMTLDENIAFLRGQQQTLAKMKSRTEGAIQALERRLTAVVTFSNELRGKVRTLRRSLVTTAGTPSEAAVRERLVVEERFTRRQMVATKVGEALPRFEILSRRWKTLQERKKSLKAQSVTAEDAQKLTGLESLFVDILRRLNFRSFSPNRFNIDPTTLHPVREGFDVVYDVSASDNVRTIAAYLTAILELSQKFRTNHPGLLILDEPRQQNLHWGDLAALLERLAESGPRGQQVIVATSDPTDRIREFADRVKCTILELEGPILRREIPSG